MLDEHPRMSREKKTVNAMIRIYCKGKHKSKENICSDCRELQRYAFERLNKCRYQENKPTCANCPIHCYKPSMRKNIRAVMRYSGPRMLRKHPILAFGHIIDGRRKMSEDEFTK
ncbi:MAG: nitrous oxide-stimulated promoter family protein [Candidatus Hodarchaeota archaeon]